MAFVVASRLVSKRLLGAQHLLFKTYNIPAMSAGTAVLQDSLPRSGENHDERNSRLKRPMSPHVTIYKFEMPSILSISHRITGLALSVYTIALSASALTMSGNFGQCLAAIEALQLGAFTILTAKFVLAFPLTYHFCNGIRHIIWDTGKQLTKKGVITTGSAMLAATVVTTALVMFL